MPYYISNTNSDCSGWAVEKDDGEVMGCHQTKQDAIDQAVAIATNEDSEFVGERSENRAAAGTLSVGDFVSWNSSGGRARGRIVEIVEDGTINVPDSSVEVTGMPTNPAALIAIYQQVEGGWTETDVRVGHKFSTLTKIEDLPEAPEDEESEGSREIRQVNLTPPAYMRAAARRGLRYYEEGKGGDGLVERTIREARAMAAGNVSADKWVRIRAWISRHLVDLDAPAAQPSSDDFPSAGVVAHLLWGSGASKRAAQRTLDYAEGVVARLEEENRSLVSVKGKNMAKIETRVSAQKFEVREDGDGMTFEGYAAVFNSPSQPLPFTEKIAAGAFHRSLRSRNDIKLLWNHDTGSVLGSTRAGTLSLIEDGYGLKVRASFPNTQLGRDTSELVRRGDIDSMSFGFSVPAGGDEWSSDGSERTLKSVRLHEVSIVAFPAYEATAGTASVRGLDKIALRAEVDADMLADAMLKVELGDGLTAEETEALSKVISSLSPQEEVEETQTEEASEESELNQAMLELKKKKLELLLKGI
jgi:HK97 family phage prohead protease